MTEALSTIAALAIVALATWLSYMCNQAFREWADREMVEERN